MKVPLTGFTIAVTGDFGPQRSREKIRQWVEANGGTFTFNITPGVTHLICSREHFKRGVAMGMNTRWTLFHVLCFFLHMMEESHTDHSMFRSPRGPQNRPTFHCQFRLARRHVNENVPEKGSRLSAAPASSSYRQGQESQESGPQGEDPKRQCGRPTPFYPRQVSFFI